MEKAGAGVGSRTTLCLPVKPIGCLTGDRKRKSFSFQLETPRWYADADADVDGGTWKDKVHTITLPSLPRVTGRSIDDWLYLRALKNQPVQK